MSRLSEECNIVLNMSPDTNLKSVIKYLNTELVSDQSYSIPRAIKFPAKNYIMYEGYSYRRTRKGLRFVPGEQEQISIMKGLGDEIGHWNLSTAYSIISDLFWQPKRRRSCDM